MWNGFLLTLVALFMRFVGMSFQLFITEHAGGEAVGLYTVIGGVYGFAVTLATSGIHLGTTRLVSEALGRDDPGEVRAARSTCLRYAFFFGFAATALLFLGAKPIGIYLLQDVRTVRSLRILSLSLLPIALSSVCNGYFTAVRRVYKNAFCSVLEQGIRIALTSLLLLYVLPKGIESACIALV
ncbi:MAG: oligosaccharide flippase family protein, partial [Clostridia bacterium]|nr:oligosaccharide flippase family protein [Clostridia bacterium]